jgi:hypothetical protein
MDPRTPLPYSSLYQCTYEITLGGWSLECKEPCHQNTNYCEKHFNEEGRIDCTGLKQEDEDRIPIPYSSLYQCEYEYRLGGWSVECKEVCHGDGHYCKEHM